MPHDAEFVVVVCENGNYRLTCQQELLVRDQIFGGHGKSSLAKVCTSAR